MGYSRNSIQSASDDATFALPKGVQYIGAQYVSRSPTDIIFVELVLSNSEATLERARDAALAAAKRDGFRSPVSDGHRFRFDAPLRPSAATQKDWLGWIVPGTALVVVNRYAHAPVTENARSLLDKLAAP